jgi:Holliday junction resolvase
MAATPEAAVKAAVRKILNSMDVYHFMPPGNGFGRAGIPDIVGCMDGMFIAIECKAGKGKTTALQERELEWIADAGGFAFVARENNLDELKQLLQEKKDGRRNEQAVA